MAKLVPESFINTLLARVDIVDVVSQKVALQKKGKNYTACCPFHQEKTPSFAVDHAKQFYHCFGCGVSGDAIKFIRETENLTFVEALEVLAAQVGLSVPNSASSSPQAGQDHSAEIYAVLAAAAEFYSLQLRSHPAAKQAVAYLKARGLDGATAKKFNLGYAPAGWDNLKQYILQNTKFTAKHLEQAGLIIIKDNNSSYDRFRNRIMFPILSRKGRIVGFGGRVMTADEEPKYLNSPETTVFNKGKELYGLYEAREFADKLAKLIVVEGYMDVLALAQAKINNVVAILGTALTSANIQLLFRIVPEIIFCFDADNAGRKAAWKAVEICLPLISANIKVNFLFLPESEDPDSYIRKHGRDQFLAKTSRAVSLADFFFSHLTDQMDLELTEDRASFVRTAQELLQQMPDGVLKHMMFDRLANLASLDRSFFASGNRTQHQFAVDQHHQHKFRRDQPRTQPKTPAIMALALLLKYPQLLDSLQDSDIEHWQNVNLSGIALFVAVASVLKASPAASFAEIRARLPDWLAKRFAPEELQTLALSVPKAGITAEFLGIINKIKRLVAEQKLEALLTKAKADGLSAAEKVQLQQLLVKKDGEGLAE